MNLLLAVAVLAPDGTAVASKQAAAEHRVLRVNGPSAARLPAGTRLRPGAALELARGDNVLLLGPLGTRRYQGPGNYRVGEPARLTGEAGSATVRMTVAAVRSPGGSVRVAVLAGGTIDLAAGLGSACAGFVSEAPDAQFGADGKDLPITFSLVGAPTDRRERLILLINDPAGEWHCSQGVNAAGQPEIRFPRQRAGRYDVWVGHAAAGRRSEAVLDIVD